MNPTITRIIVGALALISTVTSPVVAQHKTPIGQTAAAISSKIAHLFLWRIENPGGKPSYAFGSIHLPSKDLMPLPSVVAKAFREANAVFCEIPFDDESVKKAAAAAINAAKPLTQVLPVALAVRADAKLKQLSPKLDIKLFNKVEVWAFAVQLVMLEAQLKDPTVPPLDLLFYKQAEAMGKQVGGIETVEEELQAMNGFSEAEQISMLQATLDEMDAAEKVGQTACGKMLNAYLSGDLDVLDGFVSKEIERYSPELYKRFEVELLTKRNRRMAERIGQKIRASPGMSQFFILGAMHYIGKGSVLELLRKDGFKVERILQPPPQKVSHD